jgi:hypothetical protein
MLSLLEGSESLACDIGFFGVYCAAVQEFHFLTASVMIKNHGPSELLA